MAKKEEELSKTTVRLSTNDLIEAKMWAAKNKTTLQEMFVEGLKLVMKKGQKRALGSVGTRPIKRS